MRITPDHPVTEAYRSAILRHQPGGERAHLIRGSDFDQGRFWRSEGEILQAVVNAVEREMQGSHDFRRRAVTKGAQRGR
ncbi:MAG: hypothetical protein ACE5FA_07110 [Dehalococcoidia bacterium]